VRAKNCFLIFKKDKQIGTHPDNILKKMITLEVFLKINNKEDNTKNNNKKMNNYVRVQKTLLFLKNYELTFISKVVHLFKG